MRSDLDELPCVQTDRARNEPIYQEVEQARRRRNTQAGGRCFEKMTHRAECVTVWCPGFICAEKKRVLAHVH